MAGLQGGESSRKCRLGGFLKCSREERQEQTRRGDGGGKKRRKAAQNARSGAHFTDGQNEAPTGDRPAHSHPRPELPQGRH